MRLLVAAGGQIVEAVRSSQGEPRDEQTPLPADALAIFNAALEEGARLHGGLITLGRKHNPAALPILIRELEVDDLRLIVLHTSFRGVFTDQDAEAGED
jgi:hypothetical protein